MNISIRVACLVRLFQQLFSSMDLKELSEARLCSAYLTDARHISNDSYSQWPIPWSPV